MEGTIKHRGWLLVYEIQYWLIVVGSISMALWFGRTNKEIVAPLLVNVPIWGIPLYSLYRSTSAVRKGHIIGCWVVAGGLSLVALFMNATSIFWAIVFAAWALYWHKSDRVRKAYPEPIASRSLTDDNGTKKPVDK